MSVKPKGKPQFHLVYVATNVVEEATVSLIHGIVISLIR